MRYLFSLAIVLFFDQSILAADVRTLAVGTRGRNLLSSLLVLGTVFLTGVPARAISFASQEYATGSYPRSVTVGDFNGDGKLDIVVANYDPGTVSVFLGNGDGTFRTKVDYVTGSSSVSVTVGDFNGDGKLDIVAANYGTGTVSVLLGNGNGTFQTKVDYTTGNTPRSVTAGDFNSDGKLDLVVANNSPSSVSVLLGNGDGTFQSKVDYITGNSPTSVTVSDFNGDGKLDLVVANNDPGSVSVLLGNGDGTFQSKVNYVTGSTPESVTVGDFNGDGKLDLAVANYVSYTISVLLGNGDGTFQTRTDYTTGKNPLFVTVGDFNGDGKVDLAVVSSSPNIVSLLLGKGDGTFQAKVDYATGNNPMSITVGDFNGDGKLDLVVANNYSNTISVLLNTTPQYTLSVGFLGAGSGSITGTAPGYANTSCDKGIPGSCTPATYQADTQVSLSATPDWKSAFTAWAGVNGIINNTATVTMYMNRSITATFDPVYRVILQPSNTLYSSIQNAYTDATSGGTIQAQNYYFPEELIFTNSNITNITLSGGLDGFNQPAAGYSTVRGLTVSSGRVTVNRIKVRP